MLDEMATNWILSKRKYSLTERGGRHRRFVRARRRSRDAHDARSGHAAVLGAGTMGAQIAAHLANAGVPTLLLDVTTDAAAPGPRARRGAASPIRSSPRDTHALIRTGSFDDLSGLARVRLARSKRSSNSSTSSSRCSSESKRTSASRPIVSSNTSGIPLAGDRRGPKRHRSGAAGSERISSTRRAICRCSKSSRSPDTTPDVRRDDRRPLPIAGSARASSSRKTRPASSPIGSAFTA